MALRLVVFDLDGTMLGADNRLSSYAVEILNKAKAHPAGLTLLAASGRSPWAADLVLGDTGVDYVIGSGGAVVYHRPSGEMERRCFARGHLDQLYQTVNERLDGVMWAWETERGIVPDEAFRVLGTRPGHKLDELLASPRCDLPDDETRSVEERLERFGPTVRILLAHPDLAGYELDRHLGRDVPAHLSSSSAVFIEVTPPNVHKGAALELFCRRHGFAQDEVVAFGDHRNDLAMLRWAGRGIAMKNSHPDVLAEVDEHTDHSNADDGAALALDKLLTDL